MLRTERTEIVEPGHALPEHVMHGVCGLFEGFYHRYHYMAKLGAPGRFRLLVRDEADVIVGFASVEPRGRFAVLSNLLVARAMQGRGIGARLEASRMRLAQDLALQPYSSCVTVGTQSQTLKIKHGLRPLNYKLGYRRNVFYENEISSGVVFSRLRQLGSPVTTRKICVDSDNRRLRILVPTQGDVSEAVDLARQHTDHFVEVFSSPDVVLPTNFIRQGMDIDLDDGQWGLHWQYQNSVREDGLNGRLDLATPVSQIVASADQIIQELHRG